MAKTSATTKPLLKKTLTWIIAGVVLLAIVLVCVTLVIFNFTDKVPFIAVPKDGSYEQVWTEQLDFIEKSLGIEKIKIEIFDSQKGLENLLAGSKKDYMLWAEIPISSQYDYTSLEVKKLTTSFSYQDLPRNSSLLYPFVNIAQTNISGDDSSLGYYFNPSSRSSSDYKRQLYFIPFSFNPWNFYKLATTESEKTPKAVISLPAKTADEVLAPLGFVMMSAIGSDLKVNDFLKTQIFSQLQNEKIFLSNPQTYNTYDSTSSFLLGDTTFAFMDEATRQNLNPTDSINIRFSSLREILLSSNNSFLRNKFEENSSQSMLITTATGIIFPATSDFTDKTTPTKNEGKIFRTEELQKSYINLICDASFLYRINQSRNVLSPWLDVSVVDNLASLITQISFSSSYCILPEMALPSVEKERKEVIQQIQYSFNNQ